MEFGEHAFLSCTYIYIYVYIEREFFFFFNAFLASLPWSVSQSGFLGTTFFFFLCYTVCM